MSDTKEYIKGDKHVHQAGSIMIKFAQYNVPGQKGDWKQQEEKEAEELEKEFADFEEVVDETAEAPAAAEEVRKRAFYSAVTNVEKTDDVVGLLCRLMEGKTKPKDVMMPIRAAMEAGVIRRPTWEEFCSEFGKDRIKSKASFSDYTNPENKPYSGADFETMREAFQAL